MNTDRNIRTNLLLYPCSSVFICGFLSLAIAPGTAAVHAEAAPYLIDNLFVRLVLFFGTANQHEIVVVHVGASPGLVTFTSPGFRADAAEAFALLAVCLLGAGFEQEIAATANARIATIVIMLRFILFSLWIRYRSSR